MGIRANIHPITPESYDAATRGDLTAFVASPEIDGTDLDKAWHAIHYLLTGNSELRFLLTGRDVAEYGGHVEAHSPEDVAALHACLSLRTTEEIMRSFDATSFNNLKIYPEGWDDGACSYVAEWLDRFRLVIQRAAANKCGIAVTLA